MLKSKFHAKNNALFLLYLGACSFERSAIPWQELDTIRMENPSEQLDTVKVKVNSKPKPRVNMQDLFICLCI